jgi:hypothetical protein
VLFRAVRRASPHPEEPARQRLRLQDPRPVACSRRTRWRKRRWSDITPT